MLDTAFNSDFLPINLLLLVCGFYILIKGSDWFVEAAADIGYRYRISPAVIGLTLVSVGTSLPELATNLYATVSGEAGIALGNILGSNIANVALVLGVGIILINKISVSRKVLNRDGVFLIFIYFLFAVFAFFPLDTNVLSRFECAVFLILFAGYLAYLFSNKDVMEEELPREPGKERFSHALVAWMFLAIGLAFILGGAKLIVDTVVKTANDFNIPKPLISATVVAFGTSVPELAITISGMVKKKRAIALGNILGSCIFNIVFVLGIVGVVGEVSVEDPNSMYFLIPTMCLSGVLLLVFMRTYRVLQRLEGIFFVLFYAVYLFYNFIQMR